MDQTDTDSGAVFSFHVYDAGHLDYLLSDEFSSHHRTGLLQRPVILLPLTNSEMMSTSSVLRESLMAHPNITEVASASSYPGDDGFQLYLFSTELNNGEPTERNLWMYYVDDQYFSTLDMEFVLGRNFTGEPRKDVATEVVVNETLVEKMGWDDPIGKKLAVNTYEKPVDAKVVGVVKDFYQKSLYDEIEPFVFIPQPDNQVMMVKFRGEIPAAIAAVEVSWNQVFANQPFDFTFLDQDLMANYQADQQRGTLFLWFSVLTITIACMGLVGLASYTAE